MTPAPSASYAESALAVDNRTLAPSLAAPGFDPRTVPVVPSGTPLAAVAPENLSPTALRHRFANPPHWIAETAPDVRHTHRVPASAAVLIAIVLRSRPTVLLTQRTLHLSNHAGQIAFAGGRTDDTDADAPSTALREAREEIGLAERWVEVLGMLPAYETGSAFSITPVVALVHPGFTLQPHAAEVADVFEVPLEFLMDPANHRRHLLDANGVLREWFSMPYPGTGTGTGTERFIWGATAGMLRNLYRFLSA